MDKRKIIVLMNILAVTFFSSCLGRHQDDNSFKNQKQVDDFYTETGGWDWVRIPLIKPYEAKKVSPKEETSNWNINFKSFLGTYNVRKVDVEDSVIYIMSGRVYPNDDSSIKTIVNNTNVPTAWYIVDSRTGVEKGFKNQLEFDKYIQSFKYTYPKWHNIDSLLDVLAKGGNLPWEPK